MDDFDYEENNSYIEENFKEALRAIAHRARDNIDEIEDSMFNYDYVDNLIYSAISNILQLSFFILFKKIYEKRYLK